MQSLIEQVKRAAEAKAHYARTGSSVLFDDLARDKLDWEHLLAHMQAQQAVCDAARKLDLDREDNNDGRAVGHWDASAEDALDAALENLKPRSDNDGK